MRARVIGLIAIVAVALAGCGFARTHNVHRIGAPPYTVGSGKVVTADRQVAAFHAVTAQSGLEVRVVHGDTAGVHVTADDNLVGLISTNVRDGVLVITVQGSLETANQLAVAVTATGTIDTVRADTGAILSIEGNTATALTVTADSGATVKVVESRATHVELTATSGSWVDMGGVQAVTANVTLGGGSTAYVSASDSISGACTGGSTLHLGAKPPSYSVTTDTSSNVLTD